MDNERPNTMAKYTTVELFRFDNGGGVKEYQAMIHVNNQQLTFKQQLDAIISSKRLCIEQLEGAVPVFERYYISDAANQADEITAVTAGISRCAVSIIQQPPLDRTKVALWLYLQTGMETGQTSEGLHEVRHGGYRHLWCGSAHNEEKDSQQQTLKLLEEYASQLSSTGCTLANNCIRTWFYVNDIDLNYNGLVKARNQMFSTAGLNTDTHFIASTGIGGRQASPQVLVQMDAYAIDGLTNEQIQYLHATTHLSPTSKYGVSFERGTAVSYGDRRHVFISGTASIDSQGEVVHVGDIGKQAIRMIDNVEALLNEADCSLNDIASITVYLRDTADYALVKSIFDKRFHGKPCIIVLASVCRPKWLIEMECMAIRKIASPQFPSF